MTDLPVHDPVDAPPGPMPADPAPLPAPVSTPIVVPPSSEPVALGTALQALIVAILNLVGYVRAWAPETFGMANGVAAAAVVVIGILVRRQATGMAKIRELAKAIPQLAAAYKLTRKD